MFLEVFESRGIWTFIINLIWICLSNYKCTGIQSTSEMSILATTHCTLLTSSVCVSSMCIHYDATFIGNMGVYFLQLSVHEFVEKVLEFDIGRCLKALEFKMCMNLAIVDQITC